MENYAGIYIQETVGYNSHIPTIKLHTIKQDADGLTVSTYGSDRIESRLTAFGNGYFKDIQNNAFVHFTKPHPDSAIQVEFWLEHDRSFNLNMKRAENKATTDQHYLQHFTGKYYNAQLDYYFRIIIDEHGQLILKRPTVRDVIMIPYSDDKFIMEGKTGAYSVYTRMLFTRNHEGKIDGFINRDSRSMNFRCDKVN